MGARLSLRVIRCIQLVVARRTLSLRRRFSTFTTRPARNDLFVTGKQASAKISRPTSKNFAISFSPITATAWRFLSRKRIRPHASACEESWKKISLECAGAFMSHSGVREQRWRRRLLSELGRARFPSSIAPISCSHWTVIFSIAGRAISRQCARSLLVAASARPKTA